MQTFRVAGLLVRPAWPSKSYPRSSRRANYALKSAGRANAGFIDKALGRTIDSAGRPSTGRMNVECRSCYRSTRLGSGWQLVTNRPRVVCQHLFNIVNPFVVHDPTNEIDLAPAEITRKYASERWRRPPVQVLPVEHPLCVQEFAIEHIKR